MTRFVVCLALLGATPLAAQQSAPSIAVTGAVSQPLTLTAADLAAMPRATVTTNNNGIATTYEGVWVSEVLKKAGLPLGSALRGPALPITSLPRRPTGIRSCSRSVSWTRR